VPIFVHKDDRSQTKLSIASVFSNREKIADDLEVIPHLAIPPAPRRSCGNNGEHRLLFPGDSIWVQGGEWKLYCSGERREAYLASLSLVMDLDFDILVPWGARRVTLRLRRHRSRRRRT